MKDGLVQPLRRSSAVERAEVILSREFALSDIVGQSSVFSAQVAKARRYARCQAAVLILGETGTGKELFAQAIHYGSGRANKSFVPVNCGALPVELVENELFGHESEAFTGARRCRRGLIEQAEGGTLFLDEIDSLPLAAQIKLLRFLQDRTYRPLGGKRSREADVRIISASNSELPVLIGAGRFRQDLYFRLSVLTLNLPPLRERREDIPLLVTHLLGIHCHELRREAKTVSPMAMTKLVTYDWPGNVRELENVLQRAIVLSKERVIEVEDSDLPEAPWKSLKDRRARLVSDFERQYLGELMAHFEGDLVRAAKQAGQGPLSFLKLLRRHDLLSLVKSNRFFDNQTASQPGFDRTKVVGGRPRKGTVEDLLAVLGDQELGRKEWYQQALRAGMQFNIRTFDRRRLELQGTGKVVRDCTGTYQSGIDKTPG